LSAFNELINKKKEAGCKKQRSRRYRKEKEKMRDLKDSKSVILNLSKRYEKPQNYGSGSTSNPKKQTNGSGSSTNPR